MLLSFHTLANGEYPQSINGAHFSQQLFKVEPSEGTLGRDYYREFYADEFIDGEVCMHACSYWRERGGNKAFLGGAGG